VFSDQAHGRWFVRMAEDQGIIMSSVLEPETIPWQAVGELGWIRVQDPLGGLDWYLSLDPSHSLLAQHAPPLGTPPGLDAAQALLRDTEGLWWKFVVAVDGGIGLEPQPPEVIPLAPPIIAVAECLEALRHVEAAGAITTLWVS
jgi:hypothetical protein